jgi:hypothetical protein
MSSEGSPPYKAKADLICQIDSRLDSVNGNDKRIVQADDRYWRCPEPERGHCWHREIAADDPRSPGFRAWVRTVNM